MVTYTLLVSGRRFGAPLPVPLPRLRTPTICGMLDIVGLRILEAPRSCPGRPPSTRSMNRSGGTARRSGSSFIRGGSVASSDPTGGTRAAAIGKWARLMFSPRVRAALRNAESHKTPRGLEEDSLPALVHV